MNLSFININITWCVVYRPWHLKFFTLSGTLLSSSLRVHCFSYLWQALCCCLGGLFNRTAFLIVSSSVIRKYLFHLVQVSLASMLRSSSWLLGSVYMTPGWVHSGSLTSLYICLHYTTTKCHAGTSRPSVSSPRLLHQGKNFATVSCKCKTSTRFGVKSVCR